MIFATQALHPFAPHLAEECWEHLTGNQTPLMTTPYPKADPKYLTEEMTTYVVQVNGKLRGKWELPLGTTKEELLALVQGEEKMAKYLQKGIAKVIYVPNKLLNIVVKKSS